MVNWHSHCSRTSQKKALFLDRDGVIIDYIPYLHRPEQVKLPEGAGMALKIWQDRGYELIIITNQSGIARGYFTLEDVEAIHHKIKEEYAQYGVTFTDIFLCPHHPESECICRKPSPYLVLEAAKKHQIDLSRSFFIGDALSDINCGIHAGCQPLLILTGLGKTTLTKLSANSPEIPCFSQLKDTLELSQERNMV